MKNMLKWPIKKSNSKYSIWKFTYNIQSYDNAEAKAHHDISPMAVVETITSKTAKYRQHDERQSDKGLHHSNTVGSYGVVYVDLK